MRLLALLVVLQFLGLALAKTSIVTTNGLGHTSADPLLTTWANSFYNATHNRAAAMYNTSTNATISGSNYFIASDNPSLSTSIPTYATPVTSYGVTAVYTFSDLDGTLNLTANIIAGILTGRITSWTDQPILDVNPGITITGGAPFRLALRNDSSETYALTNYLSQAAQNWTLGAVRSLPCPPGGTICSFYANNTALLQAVNRGSNALGFVLLGSAVTYSRVSRANVQNANGFFVAPTDVALMAAVNSTTIPSPGSVITVANAPGNYSYPIASFVYIYVPQDITTLGLQGTATLAFLDYVLSNSSQTVGLPMNFYPLPSAVGSFALSVISNVNVNDDQDPSKFWPYIIATTAPTQPVTQAPVSTSASTTGSVVAGTTTGPVTTTRNFAGATACSVLAAISFVACVAYDLNRRRLAGLTLIENDIYK